MLNHFGEVHPLKDYFLKLSLRIIQTQHRFRSKYTFSPEGVQLLILWVKYVFSLCIDTITRDNMPLSQTVQLIYEYEYVKDRGH